MRENLFFQTDTLPQEIPFMFTNRNLFMNFDKSFFKQLRNDQISLNSEITIPYNFFIPKSNETNRKMSLLHPIAQIQMFVFILQYDQLITSFCKRSIFSVRSPVIRNQPILDLNIKTQKQQQKIEEEFGFQKNMLFTSDESLLLFYNYFSYRYYKSIDQLLTSQRFRRSIYKYEYFLKLDIQNFFPSIYTHAISWAIFGDKSKAKFHRQDKLLFANATDELCMSTNFGETNGIPVGSEFSRVIAEILMTQIDVEINSELKKNNLNFNKQFTIYRFVDDYYIFSTNENNLTDIKRIIEHTLDKYNLKININKSSIQQKPIQLNNPAISKLKVILKLYHPSSNQFISKSSLSDIQSNIELLINEYPDSKQKIVTYFIKYIRVYIKQDIKSYNLKYLIEMVCNIFTLKINYYTTKYLIAFCSLITSPVDTENTAMIIKENENEQFDNFVFWNIVNILENNIDKIDIMYELIIYIKSFEEKLQPKFLVKILDLYPKNYFVLSCIAYYILNNDKSCIDSSYRTVLKKIEKLIIDFEATFSNKGLKFLLNDSEYFYIVNDFSYYPGFKDQLKTDLKSKLISNSAYNSAQKLNAKKKAINDIIEKITSAPYFNWEESSDNFIKDIARKLLNTRNSFEKYDDF